ncbi:MAG TPA: DUF2017 family protein, partial [Actinomycetes bacterium]|nr:DUF2017 family protein [Actinomycetes bacterium]
MVATFRRARRGDVAATFGADEHRVLRHLVSEMLELLPADDAADADPLAAAVGIGTSTERPSDPALARLFPDGYSDDEDASA